VCAVAAAADGAVTARIALPESGASPAIGSVRVIDVEAATVRAPSTTGSGVRDAQWPSCCAVVDALTDPRRVLWTGVDSRPRCLGTVYGGIIARFLT
jgi:hypothetical protein